jgi:hypothetical protein
MIIFASWIMIRYEFKETIYIGGTDYCFRSCCLCQTIRNANNSMLATINSNGEVRNSNNSLIARISNNGDIRVSNGHLIARLDGGTIRNPNNTVLGYINPDGTVRNNNNSVLG